jgi:3',5'-nucleoside bisphosphate phosphatase
VSVANARLCNWRQRERTGAGTLESGMPAPDLHTHSNQSDGVLTPTELVRRASERGVDVLALTDHDTVAGYREARDAASRCAITLVPGCEISVTWESLTLHVVGLQIDIDSQPLNDGLADLRKGRIERAQRIAASLERAGIARAYQGALAYVTRDDLVARTHFARFLVATGAARDMKQVFKRFLAPGKPGYVPHAWASLGEAVGWIRAAGGQAVLAHPGRYPATPTRMRRLLGEFRDAGGTGLEVLSPCHTREQVGEYATLARVHGLVASQGSDYPAPDESRFDLGTLPALPSGVTPIWQDW